MNKNDSKGKSREFLDDRKLETTIYFRDALGEKFNIPIQKTNIDLVSFNQKMEIEFDSGLFDIHAPAGSWCLSYSDVCGPSSRWKTFGEHAWESLVMPVDKYAQGCVAGSSKVSGKKVVKAALKGAVRGAVQGAATGWLTGAGVLGTAVAGAARTGTTSAITSVVTQSCKAGN